MEQLAGFQRAFSTSTVTRGFHLASRLNAVPFIGGCKNSFTLKMAHRNAVFNIALQAGKTIPTCCFLPNADKCTETAFCANFFLTLVQVPMLRKYATFFVIKFSKQLTLLAELCGSRGAVAVHRGMIPCVFHHQHPTDMSIPFYR